MGSVFGGVASVFLTNLGLNMHKLLIGSIRTSLPSNNVSANSFASVALHLFRDRFIYAFTHNFDDIAGYKINISFLWIFYRI